MSDFTTFQVLTSIVAAIGAVLGVLNTWRNFRLDRVRLRVRPQNLLIPNDSTKYVGITVVNTGAVTVTISDVGFCLGRLFERKRLATIGMALGLCSLSAALPKRLEPRESATFIVPVQVLNNIREEIINSAYVRTSCEEIRTGKSPALKSFLSAAE